MEKWYQKTWFTVLMLFLFWPVGLFLMWKYRSTWKKAVKIIITVLFAIGFIGVIVSPKKPEEVKTEAVSKETSKKEVEKEEPKEVKNEPVEKPKSEPAPVPEPEPEPEPEISLGQKNALAKADAYLNYTAFSYSGLIEQLEYEGFSTEDSTYAADNCGADWNEQAAIKAQQYLDYSAFSRDGLIEQLEYEGFSYEEAEYGVTAVGY